MSQVVDKSIFQEFKYSVSASLDKHKEDDVLESLEDYLLALWVVIEKHKNLQPSYLLFAAIINEAFETPPCEFNEQWLAYEDDLFWAYENGSYVIKEFKNGNQFIVQEGVDDYKILKHAILH